MKLPLILFCSALVGCGPSSTKEREWPIPISVEMLRKESVERKMRLLKETAFLGDAELGIHGGADILRELTVQAKAEFPDGEYGYLMSGATGAGFAEWTCYGTIIIGPYYRTLYKKIESEPIDPSVRP